MLKQKVGDKISIKGEIFIENAQTKNEEHYFKLKIIEISGKEIKTSIFNESNIYKSIKKDEIKNGDFCKIDLTITNPKLKYLTINSIELIPRIGIDSDVIDIQLVTAKFKDEFILLKTKSPNLYDIVFQVFSEQDLKEGFFGSPLTEMSGYSFRGGILAQTLRTIYLAKALCKVYSDWNFNLEGSLKINEELILTGCILHNIGKAFYLEIENSSINKTFYGELINDSLIGMRKILGFIENSKLSEKDKILLIHLLTSSKGKQSSGAINTPKTKEAIILHYISNMDLKLASMEQLIRFGTEDKIQSMFIQNLYLGDFEK